MAKGKELKNTAEQHKPERNKGGRPKGHMNRKTEWIFELCEKHNFDPVEALIHIAKMDYQKLGYTDNIVEKFGVGGIKINEERITLDHRLDANKTLINYMYPKRKAVEIDHSNEKPREIVLRYSDNELEKDADNDDTV